jgi:hypothetical protein
MKIATTGTRISSEEITKKILELNATHNTWKEKLEVVSKVVAEYKLRPGFTSDGLALLAAYLYFINSH